MWTPDSRPSTGENKEEERRRQLCYLHSIQHSSAEHLIMSNLQPSLMACFPDECSFVVCIQLSHWKQEAVMLTGWDKFHCQYAVLRCTAWIYPSSRKLSLKINASHAAFFFYMNFKFCFMIHIKMANSEIILQKILTKRVRNDFPTLPH